MLEIFFHFIFDVDNIFKRKFFSRVSIDLYVRLIYRILFFTYLKLVFLVNSIYLSICLNVHVFLCFIHIYVCVSVAFTNSVQCYCLLVTFSNSEQCYFYIYVFTKLNGSNYDRHSIKISIF